MNAYIVNGILESKYIILHLIERRIDGTTMVPVM